MKLEQPISNDQKDFEEYSSKEARKFNSFVENLLGKGVITKEDVIRVDAELENDLRDKINELKQNGLNHDDINKYQQLLELFQDAKGIQKTTTEVFGGINSVTHAYEDKKVKAMGIDVVGRDSGDGKVVFRKPYYKLLEELEKSRIAAIEKLIKERKQ